MSWGAEEKERHKELSKTCTSLHLRCILEACDPLAIIFEQTMCNAGITKGRIKDIVYSVEVFK